MSYGKALLKNPLTKNSFCIVDYCKHTGVGVQSIQSFIRSVKGGDGGGGNMVLLQEAWVHDETIIEALNI